MSDAKPMSNEDVDQRKRYLLITNREDRDDYPITIIDARRLFALYDQTVRERDALQATVDELRMSAVELSNSAKTYSVDTNTSSNSVPNALTVVSPYALMRLEEAAEAALKQQEPDDGPAM